MRGALAVFLLMSFQLAMVALFKAPIPSSNEQLLTYMLGQLSGMVTTALAFYFATSQGSVDKTQMLATRPSGTPSDPISVDETPEARKEP